MSALDIKVSRCLLQKLALIVALFEWLKFSASSSQNYVLEIERKGFAQRREHPLPKAGGVGGLRRSDRRYRLQPVRGGQREDAERRQVAAGAEKEVGEERLT